MHAGISGRFQDRLTDAAGRGSVSDWDHNTIVYRALDLMAGLLANRPGLRGPLWWAVGEGDPAWDAAAPAEDPRTTRLAREIFRRPLDPARDITYDPNGRTLTLHTVFG